MSKAQALKIAQIGSVGEARLFTLAEARSLFPLVRRITAEAYEELAPVKQRLENMIATDPHIVQVEKSYEAIVKRWVSKMERLGLVVKGLWLVDFDTGDGYLCWKFPELQLGHYHDHGSGYADRRPLAEVIDELDPDWA